MWPSSFLVSPFPPPNLLLSNRRLSVKAHQNDSVSAGQTGKVGPTTLVAALQPEGSQMSGSDVLRALQRASERKKVKMMKKKETVKREEGLLSTVGGRREDLDGHVDFDNVRPLCVKTEWGDKLDELEKQLSELSEIII